MGVKEFILSVIILTATASAAYGAGRRFTFYPMDVVPESYIQEYGADDFFTISNISDELFAFMYGKSYKEGCPVSRSELRYLQVLHRNLVGQSIVGEMVVNECIAEDVLNIFRELYRNAYPIEKMRLVDWYDADDEASMQDNNTSAFNSRNITYTNMVSKHGAGKAVDINPLYNPAHKIHANGRETIEPSAGRKYLNRDADFPYKIVRGDLCHHLFTSHGFQWGGGWASSKDFQHFELLY